MSRHDLAAPTSRGIAVSLLVSLLVATHLVPSALAQSATPPWTQRGQDLYGLAKEDWFGSKVAMSRDGTVLAVSAVHANNFQGYVQVYSYNKSSSTWARLGAAIRGDSQGDYSGQAIALSADGKRLAIGSPFSFGDSVYLAKGDVRVYEWNTASTSWRQMGIDIYAEASRDKAGMSVALSKDGSVLAVGAPHNDGASGRTTLNSGQVRVFDWSTAATKWIQRGNDIDGENYYDFSGTSVALSGDGLIVAIGAPYNDGSGTKDVSTDTRTNFRGFDGGQVRVYKWSNSAWSKLGADIDGMTQNAGFGETIAMSDDASLLAVAAPGWNVDNGVVKIFSWNGVNWIQKGQDIVRPSDGGYYDFPVAMSADGKQVAVGMPAETATNATGSVSVYSFTGAVWEQHGTFTGKAVSEHAGTSIALSQDGSVLAVGAPQRSGSITDYIGATRVYFDTSTSSAPTRRPTQSPSRSPITRAPTKRPTARPTRSPTKKPTILPTRSPVSRPPTRRPTAMPTRSPTKRPTARPTLKPSMAPSKSPTRVPTRSPISKSPTRRPTARPTRSPTRSPVSKPPTKRATARPTLKPTKTPTKSPTMSPTRSPVSKSPTRRPTARPTRFPTKSPVTRPPTTRPTARPTFRPTKTPSKSPTKAPTRSPVSKSPTRKPTSRPTRSPTKSPVSRSPTKRPSRRRTQPPTKAPTKFPTLFPTVAPTITSTFESLTIPALVRTCMQELFVTANCQCDAKPRDCLRPTIRTNCNYSFRRKSKRRKFFRKLNKRILKKCDGTVGLRVWSQAAATESN